MSPADFVDPRIWLNVTLEEHVYALSQRSIQRICAQFQAYNGYIYKGGYVHDKYQSWVDSLKRFDVKATRHKLLKAPRLPIPKQIIKSVKQIKYAGADKDVIIL